MISSQRAPCKRIVGLLAYMALDLFATTIGIFMPREFEVLAACSLALTGLGALIWRKPRIDRTTLVAPWYWSVVSLLAVATSEVFVGHDGGVPQNDWATTLRFAAAMATFCPIMAVLGAKRPQDRGWQFIVLTLWAVLSLPGFKWLLFGGVQEIHPARFGFLVILILIGAANGIGTRFWPSSVLIALGQVALVAPYLPLTQSLLPEGQFPLVGLLGLVVAWWLLALDVPRARPASNPPDRVWLDFRDAFGAVWGLRVAERFNAAAAIGQWPVALGWQGFRPSTASAPPSPRMGEGRVGRRLTERLEIPEPAIENLRTVLRRFVSQGWIDARLVEREREDLTASIP